MSKQIVKSPICNEKNTAKVSCANEKIQHKNDAWDKIERTGTNVQSYGPFIDPNTKRAFLLPDVVNSVALMLDPPNDDHFHFAVTKVGTLHYAAEYSIASLKTRVVSISFNNGCVSAADIDDISNCYSSAEPILSNNEYDCTGYFACLIAYIWEMAEDPESVFNKCGLDKTSCFDVSPCSPEFSKKPEGQRMADLRDKLIQLSVTIQKGIENGTFKVTIPADGNVDMLTQRKLDSLYGSIVCGHPKYLPADTTVKGKIITMMQARKMFAEFAGSHHWTKEEKMLIPHLADDFEVPAEAIKFASRFVKTWKDKRPMKQFMWRGITSYGKSTGVEAIADMLHMPLVRMTCSTRTETQDFLSTFVPASSCKQLSSVPNLTYEDISYDPEGAYEQLTGQQISSISPSDVFELYTQKLTENAKATAGNRFELVESNYIKGLTRGYLVEVQEASRIKDSGVLVGLNEYDRPGAVIPMVDGTYARRSENAMVIFTDNIGYDSCRSIDPSVLRRFALIIDSNELSEATVISRLQYNTGCTDKQLIDQLYDIWSEIQIFCKENEITDGSISVTELEMWLRLVMLDGEDAIKDDCMDAVISKATADPDEQLSIMAAIETKF